MKASKIAKFTGACALAIGCTAVTPTYAQTDATPQYQERTDDRNFGWIGLLGLVGLAGLMGRKREAQHYDATRGTTTAR